MGELTNYMNKVDNINKTGVNFQEDDFAKAFQQSERANMKAKLQKLDELDNFNISDDEMKKAFQQIERQELKKKLQRLSEEDVKNTFNSKTINDAYDKTKKFKSLKNNDKIKKDNIGELKDFNISDAEIKKAVTLNERDALKKKLEKMSAESELNQPTLNSLDPSTLTKFDPSFKNKDVRRTAGYLGLGYGLAAAVPVGMYVNNLLYNKRKQSKPAQAVQVPEKSWESRRQDTTNYVGPFYK
jgi:hypothetical protein